MADNDEKLAQFQVHLIKICPGTCNQFKISLSPLTLNNYTQDDSIKLFQSITGCDAERAQFYLESAGFALDLAMASFYEGEVCNS